MINRQTVLGVILARGGSKGLPRKNLRALVGKPLIAWTINAGLRSECVDRLVLSSDDEEIIRTAEEYGCEAPFRRPAELARDESTSMEALLHALNQVPRYDYVVLLQPTSPLRTTSDIDVAITTCYEKEAPACVTVSRTDKPPQWMYTLTENGTLRSVLDPDEVVTRRQSASPTYVLNGSVYVARVDWLRRNRSFISKETVTSVVPKQRSIDIDDHMDLTVARCLLERQGTTQ